MHRKQCHKVAKGFKRLYEKELELFEKYLIHFKKINGESVPSLNELKSRMKRTTHLCSYLYFDFISWYQKHKTIFENSQKSTISDIIKSIYSNKLIDINIEPKFGFPIFIF